MMEWLNGKKSHPDREVMVAYVTGTCSAEGRKVIEKHCLECFTCRSQLSLLLRLSISPADADERLELEPFLSLGQQAAAQARTTIKQQEQSNRRFPFSWPVLGEKLRNLRPVLNPALIIIVLFIGS